MRDRATLDPDPARRRHFTFGIHVICEFLVGVGLAALAIALDFSEGALIAALALGVTIATTAISTTITGHSILAHKSWDRVLVGLLIVAAVASAIADPGLETAVFAGAAALEATLLEITRYVAERT